MSIADDLKAAKPALIAVLGANMTKEVEGYFARTVDATQDLKEAIYRGGTRQVLQVGTHIHIQADAWTQYCLFMSPRFKGAVARSLGRHHTNDTPLYCN